MWSAVQRLKVGNSKCVYRKPDIGAQSTVGQRHLSADDTEKG